MRHTDKNGNMHRNSSAETTGYYDCLNRCVFRRCLDSSCVGVLRPFVRQVVPRAAGPATVNARLPSSRRVHGTNRMPCAGQLWH